MHVRSSEHDSDSETETETETEPETEAKWHVQGRQTVDTGGISDQWEDANGHHQTPAVSFTQRALLLWILYPTFERTRAGDGVMACPKLVLSYAIQDLHIL